MDKPVKNLIGKNYKRFTFDLVRWTKFRFQFSISRWTFNIGEGPKQRTFRLRLGFYQITIWWKNDKARVDSA